MKKILIAVPTKDRSDMVEEVLEYEIPYYKKYDVALCFYDSSVDGKTEHIIHRLSQQNKFEIHYKKMDSSLCLDNKMIELLKDFTNSGYDYVWIINDSIAILEDMLNYVMQKLDEQYDLIRLPLSGEGQVEDYITEDVNDWFQNCSSGMAHMASTVMSRTLLDMDIEWDHLKDKYIYNNALDDKHGYFFTVGFYLEQICRLKKFKGLFIGNKFKWRRDSPLKKQRMYWSEYVFEAWGKSYPETILKLPDIYTNKEDVIRSSDNIRVGRFSKEMLIHYRLNGMYDEKKFEKYRSYFQYITDETEDTCHRISIEPVENLKQCYSHLSLLEGDWEKKLETIERTLGKSNIYLYGAGLYGERAAQKLSQDGYVSFIKSILVTNAEINITSLCGIPVQSIKNVTVKKDEKIIICTLPKTAEMIKKELMKRNIRNYIGLFDV